VRLKHLKQTNIRKIITVCDYISQISQHIWDGCCWRTITNCSQWNHS